MSSPNPQTLAYGQWTSPITEDLIADQSISFDDIQVDLVNSTLYHVERRPSEGGRAVTVDTLAGTDIFGPVWSSRTHVEEYGGSCIIAFDGTVFFSHDLDCRIYKVIKGDDPIAVTPDNPAYRYADFTIHPKNPEILVSILEDHTIDVPASVVTTLVSVNTNTSTLTTFASGADFYSSATFSPSGTRIAWIQWYFPDMPWDGTELYVADIDIVNGAAVPNNAVKIAGERLKTSAVQPRWVTDDVLLFTSDQSGYQNPWIIDLSAGTSGASPLFKQNITEDFGEPAWFLGDVCNAILDENTVIYTSMRSGKSVLYYVTLSDRSIVEISCPFVHVSRLRRISSSRFAFLGESAVEPIAVVVCTLNGTQDPDYEVAKSSSGSTADIAPYFSTPEAMQFNNADDEPVFIVYYSPTNPDFVPPQGEKPPLVVFVHGGPTSLTTQGMNLKQQYFTSRGYAWVNVNYGGSSGYGRKYIDRLNPNWGIVDTKDCAAAVNYLISLGAADAARVVITGGSSGGYSVLQSMCTTTDVYAAGTSSYGISDLTMLYKDTHKFESHYPEYLLGGTPETVPQVYYDRSPVNHAANIKSPLLMLSGADDKVVPPEQSEEMAKVIKENGGIACLVIFPGEGHGWVKSSTIKAALIDERKFYEKYLGIYPSD